MPLTGARPEVAVVVAIAAPFAGRMQDEPTAVPRLAPDAAAPSSDERVLDADPGDCLAVLEILAQEAHSTQPRSRDDHQGVPERQLAAVLEIGRFEDVSRIDAVDRPGAVMSDHPPSVGRRQGPGQLAGIGTPGGTDGWPDRTGGSSSKARAPSRVPLMVAAGDLLAGRYRIGSALGKGGMATVHRAVDLRLGRDVAIKLLTPQRAATATVPERFLREARAMAAIDHPSIVAIYDVEWSAPGGEHDPFLVMEFVAGCRPLDVVDRDDARGRPRPPRCQAAEHPARGGWRQACRPRPGPA